MDPKLLGAYLFALAFDVAMPLALAVFVRRRLGVSWRYFWYGALVFFLFQMITRIPAVQVLQMVLAEPLRNSEALRWAWLFALALTAGLFEEVGRYLGYRHLVFRGAQAPGTTHQESEDAGTRGRGDAERWSPPLPSGEGQGEDPNPSLPSGEGRGGGAPSTLDSRLSTQPTQFSAPSPRSSSLAPDTQHSAWRKGIMYGLGHGGVESMLLVGGTVLLTTINVLVIMRMEPTSLAALPPDQQEALRQARAILEGIPWWFPLLGAFERLCTVAVQVAFSILVLQVFLRGSIRWLYLAIFAHFAVDFVAVGSMRWLGPVGTEGLIAVLALGALYLIFRLRPEPARNC